MPECASASARSLLECQLPGTLAKPVAHFRKTTSFRSSPSLIDRKKQIDRSRSGKTIAKGNPSFLLNHIYEVGAVDCCQRRLLHLTVPVTKSNYCDVLKADSIRTD
tara:strand:+ start:75064 stop:75381 length:318 start_codon:yes stop_codon:yes gene_type:complete